jgi:hypothetical protein
MLEISPKLASQDSCYIDSKAGKKLEGKKLQISTGQRVYSQITGMPVISSDEITNLPNL